LSHDHGAHDAPASAPTAYEPPLDIDPIVLFIPPILGITLVTTVITAVIWF
jgi:hypothetical protein